MMVLKFQVIANLSNFIQNFLDYNKIRSARKKENSQGKAKS